ncbi:MAG: hypothetical protein RL701_1337 [Pseudomonadota bacterium]|jgi:uncharacterized protein involved in exopolysaccharide biosynthesis
MLTSLSPNNLSYLIFKRLRVFLGVLTVSISLYCGLVLTQKSQYESTASILVKVVDSDIATPDQFSEQQGRSAPSAANMAKQIINSEQVIITSEDVLKSALERVGVAKVYPDIAKAASKSRVPQMTLAVERMLKDISISVNNDTNVLMLSMFNSDPRVARNALSALVAATVDKQASVMRDPRLQFLETKLATLKSESDKARQTLLDFKQRTHITSFDEERSLLLKQRDETQLRLAAARSELAAAEGRGAVLDKTLKATPDQIALSNENDSMLRQMDEARTRVTGLSAQVEAARQRFTADNPELRDLTAQLESAKKNMQDVSGLSGTRTRTGANPLSLRIGGDLSTARSEADAQRNAVAEREKQLTEINSRLSYLDNNEAVLRELDRRWGVSDKDYQSYLTRVQSARIINDMNQAGITNLSVVQAPSMPYKPARPKKLLLFVLALFAGLAGGLALCLLLEMLDDTIALPEQVEALTGLPLLAVVDEHVLPEQIR